jgi:hypothetical protein
MMTPLYQELHRWSAVPFEWGETDCMTSLCDWLVLCGWPDPMADLRGIYDDAASCQRATGYIRDPMGVTTRLAESIALPRGNDLKAGDVAVIKVPGPRWPVGALWTGQGWAVKGPTGTTTIRAGLVEILAFWSVGYQA